MHTAFHSGRGALVLAAAAVVSAATPAPPRAATAVDGMTYTFRTTAQSGGDAGDARVISSMLARGQVAGGKARIDFIEAQNQGFVAPGQYMLVRDGGRLTVVSPKDKSYFDVDLAALGQMFSALTGGGALMKFSITDFSADVANLGAGEPILGYRTDHYRMVQHYTMAVRVLMMTQRSTHDDTTDLWYGPDVRDLANPFNTRAVDGALAFFGNSPDAADKLRAATAKLPKQVALRSVMQSLNVDGKGKRERSRVTTEVTALARGNVDPSTFEIPAGYTAAESPTGALSALSTPQGGSGAASGAAATGGAPRPADTTSVAGAVKNGATEGAKEGAKEGAREGAQKAVRKLFGRP